MKLSYKQKFISLAMVYGILLTIIAEVADFTLTKNSIEDISKKHMQDKILEKKDYLKKFILNSKNILKALKENEEFIDFVQDGEAVGGYDNKYHLRILFETLIKTKYNMMQLRYIDVNGNEKIRVDQRDYKVTVVEGEKLQNKIHKSYFKDAIKLNKDEFYISKIDLNMEQGKIEKPIRPTVRLATPIFDEDIKKGILIINFCLKGLIKNLKDLTLYNFYMVDKDGGFLIHPDNKKSWSKQLLLNYNLRDEISEYASKILNSNSFFSSTLISKKLYFLKNQDVRVILTMKYEKLEEQNDKRNLYKLLIMLIIILISLPFAYFLSLLPEKLMNKLRDNLTFQKELFKTIPIPIFIKNTKGKYIECNEAFAKFLGISKEKVIGKSIFDFVEAKDANYEKNIDKNLISQNGSKIYESKVKYKNSGQKTIIIHKTALVQNHLATGIMGSIVDITERKKSEEKLKETQQKITDSIKFSSMIQNSILPLYNPMENFLSDYFIVWKPKDIVGGDIYLFEEFENGCLICVIDCTGHGVPGAFMTMVTKTSLNTIINKNSCSNPAKILKELNINIKNTLRQDREDTLSNVGLDGGIIYYDKLMNKVTFAGAKTPLFYIQNNELKTLKGNRESIGYKNSNSEFRFKNYEIEINNDTYFYLTTDGIIDQNGGKKGFPYGKRRLKNIINRYYKEPFDKQKTIIFDSINEYQGDEERSDDITMIGFKIKGRK